ncbi:ATP-grasp fold amidoligase family protein [Rhizobium sp. G21]|uniref:ATP-grasp fold amidoligase family protein n=1 Tax=Rhizobium sp. G21 TaxID=2758439 RepID=UPI0028AF3388|nr:ATP-grasp fold amidoligase family protein [Rhizobium sp. G21]
MSEADRKETFLIPGYQDRTLKELVHHAIWRLIAPLPDRPYIAVKYRVIKGAWPDLKQPKTFTEKVQARKLHDRNPLFPVVVDKAAMKDYVARRVGGDYVIPSYWVGTDLADVDWKAVELPAVVKPTHASAQGRFLYHARDIDNLLTDNPAPRWLTLDHAAYNREWAYAEVSPRIVIEQMLRTQGAFPGIIASSHSMAWCRISRSICVSRERAMRATTVPPGRNCPSMIPTICLSIQAK